MQCDKTLHYATEQLRHRNKTKTFSSCLSCECSTFIYIGEKGREEKKNSLQTCTKKKKIHYGGGGIEESDV